MTHSDWQGADLRQAPRRHRRNFTRDTIVKRQSDGNEIFYRYHGDYNQHGKGYSYVTNKKYSSEAELRKDLALLKEWGVEITHVTTFRPKRGTWITEGTAAPQSGRMTSEFLEGGGYQALIKSNDLPSSSIISIEKVNF